MLIFTADPKALGTRGNGPLLVFSLYLATAFLLSFVIDWVWPSRGGKPTILALILDSGVFAVGFSILSWAPFHFRSNRKGEKYELAIDEDEMKMNLAISTFVVFIHVHKSVRRGQIKTLIERKRGLTVSRYGRIGAILFGGIWIPKKMPEYDFLKHLAISWKVPPG